MDLPSDFTERRIKPRITCAYPALVRGLDANGDPFSENTRLANLSSSGLFLRLRTVVNPEASLSVVFRCSNTSPLDKGKGPLVSLEGNVVRCQPHNGEIGVAVKIQHYHFL